MMQAPLHAGNPNPRDGANCFSSLVFWWTVRLFREGYTRDLTQNDLWNPREADRSQHLGDTLEKEWLRHGAHRGEFSGAEGRTEKEVSLLRAVWRAFGFDYMRLGVLMLVWNASRLSQPLLLGGLLTYLSPEGGVSRESAFAYAAGVVVLAATMALCNTHFTMGVHQMGMRVRAACCALVYRKVLRLSQASLSRTAPGKVVNLLSNDVSRLEHVAMALHHIWTSPLVVAWCVYCMHDAIGWPAFVGVAVVFIICPLQAYTGRLVAKFRHQTALKTDERVRLMDEIVSGIQVIKMYAWEKPFSKLVALSRRLEIRVVRRTCFLRGLHVALGLCTTRVALAAALAAAALVDAPGSERALEAAPVFVALSYFMVLSQAGNVVFVRGVSEVAEALVSMRRLQDFMCLEERDLPPQAFNGEPSKYMETGWEQSGVNKNENNVTSNSGDKRKEENHQCEELMIELCGVTARWNSSNAEDTLSAVDLVARRGQLIAVVGPVGSGKSSLLLSMLGELPVEKGTVRVRERTSFAAQTPWVFASSLRQNVVMGRPMRKRRYERVLRACALEHDVLGLPLGDLTPLGEHALSGGQRSRLALARAVYTEASVYLLDDPLSAVDTHVAKHLFEECICGFLSNMTRVLATHQLHFLKYADHIVVMNNGRVEMQGDYSTLSQNAEFGKLLAGGDDNGGFSAAVKMNTFNNEPASVPRTLRQISSKSEGESENDVDVSHAAMDADITRGIVEELSSKGRVQGKSVYVEYVRAGNCPFAAFTVFLLLVLTQVGVSGVDWLVSYWMTQEEIRRELSEGEPKTENPVTSFPTQRNSSQEHLRLNETLLPPLSSTDYSFVHLGAAMALLSFAILRSLGFYGVATRCSERLHAAMFSAVVRARMRFFDTNPTGRILNRFSKDMGSVDEMLPKSMMDGVQVILQVVGAIAVTVSVNVYFLIPVIIMGILFWLDKNIYLRSSKNIKRIEGIAKSPVFSHLHATLQGLTTIRTLNTQQVLQQEFDSLQDMHTSAWYMFMATSAAFAFSLEVLVITYISIVTFSFLMISGAVGAQAGLAITQARSLSGMMQWGIRQTAEIANHMTSVERILEYSLLDEEPRLDAPPARKAPDGWPSRGALRLEDVWLRYAPRAEPALRGLWLSVRAGHKVGVVGRSGAGKTSLVYALFRLAYSQEGRILVDDEDTGSLGLGELRSRLAIIPQEPVLFSGSLRTNVDPFGEFSDDALCMAIREVELRDTTQSPMRLDARVDAGGANFSVGQRQLVCLARAILRKSRILVLDEATANVDPHTDYLIQHTIRHKFSDCTVVTVAHRLNTVIDCDMILVMDAGRMVEYDHPHILLQNRAGVFYSLVQETGPAMANTLEQTAKQCYDKKTAHLYPELPSTSS